MNTERRELPYEDWLKEGEERFGADRKQWWFVCPVCGVVTQVQEWLDAGVEGMIAFSCIGRTMPPDKTREALGGEGEGPCDYAGGGLFRLNPVTITGPEGTSSRFEFATDEQVAAAKERAA